MTGFGSARGKVGSTQLSVEVRAVNHRYLEINSRLPHRFASLEGEVAKQVRSFFDRGKFDLFAREQVQESDTQELVIARDCFRMLQQVRKDLKIKQEITISDLLAFREIYQARYGRDDLDKLSQPFLALVSQALKKLEQMRLREGGHLEKWFKQHLMKLNRLVDAIERQVKESIRQYQKRLRHKMKHLGTVESGRIDQETAIMSDRLDVTEELVRLRSHLKEFLRILQGPGVIGRKLDFLSQEMGREINTIGSKSQGVKLSHQVVEFKSDLEKIREQVQNIE